MDAWESTGRAQMPLVKELSANTVKTPGNGLNPSLNRNFPVAPEKNLQIFHVILIFLYFCRLAFSELNYSGIGT
jgi:hypothetical protein